MPTSRHKYFRFSLLPSATLVIAVFQEFMSFQHKAYVYMMGKDVHLCADLVPKGFIVSNNMKNILNVTKQRKIIYIIVFACSMVRLIVFLCVYNTHTYTWKKRNTGLLVLTFVLYYILYFCDMNSLTVVKHWRVEYCKNVMWKSKDSVFRWHIYLENLNVERIASK